MHDPRSAAPTLLDIRSMKPAYCAQFIVTLDGVVQDRCVVADAARGYVVRYLSTPAPWFRRQQLGTQRVQGHVVIEWREPKGAA